MAAINTLEFINSSISKVDARFVQLMNQYLVSKIYAVSKSCPDSMVELWLYNRVLADWHQGINGDVYPDNSLTQEQINSVLTKALLLSK